jgi:hypothetical protein
MKPFIFLGMSALWLGMLACRPVLAIGWGEFFFVVLVIALLVGPPLYRLVRRVNFDRGDDQRDKAGK